MDSTRDFFEITGIKIRLFSMSRTEVKKLKKKTWMKIVNWRRRLKKAQTKKEKEDAKLILNEWIDLYKHLKRVRL